MYGYPSMPRNAWRRRMNWDALTAILYGLGATCFFLGAAVIPIVRRALG